MDSSSIIFVAVLSLSGLVLSFKQANHRLSVAPAEKLLDKEHRRLFHRSYRCSARHRDMLAKFDPVATAYDKKRRFNYAHYGTFFVLLIAYLIWRSV